MTFGSVIESFSLGKMMEQDNTDHAQKTDDHLSIHGRIPGLSPSSYIYRITTSSRIVFGTSNEREDAGQTFVPFLDSNEVTLNIKAPLAGIGLLHYSNRDDYAGYIKPYIRTLNYVDYLSWQSAPVYNL